jgi:hypothetical protein
MKKAWSTILNSSNKGSKIIIRLLKKSYIKIKRNKLLRFIVNYLLKIFYRIISYNAKKKIYLQIITRVLCQIFSRAILYLIEVPLKRLSFKITPKKCEMFKFIWPKIDTNQVLQQ